MDIIGITGTSIIKPFPALGPDRRGFNPYYDVLGFHMLLPVSICVTTKENARRTDSEGFNPFFCGVDQRKSAGLVLFAWFS